jgi:hypothetical protein
MWVIHLFVALLAGHSSVSFLLLCSLCPLHAYFFMVVQFTLFFLYDLQTFNHEVPAVPLVTWIILFSPSVREPMSKSNLRDCKSLGWDELWMGKPEGLRCTDSLNNGASACHIFLSFPASDITSHMENQTLITVCHRIFSTVVALPYILL